MRRKGEKAVHRSSLFSYVLSFPYPGAIYTDGTDEGRITQEIEKEREGRKKRDSDEWRREKGGQNE